MWRLPFIIAFILLPPAPGGYSQSLGELGRKEAERRKNLEERGVQCKVIEGGDPARLARNGNLSTSAPARGKRNNTASVSPRSAASRSVASFRTALQRLDRQIRQLEDRVSLLDRRAQTERWAPPPVGRISRSGVSAGSEQRIRHEIEDLEIRLRSLKAERLETYDAARRAGFLPGEIDGKGINP